MMKTGLQYLDKALQKDVKEKQANICKCTIGLISFNKSLFRMQTYNKLYFGICCKSLALAFGTTFALNMVRALLMFPLKEV